MQGFAVIDSRFGEENVAVWIVSKVPPAGAGNTNAVVVARTDPRAQEALRSLTRSRAVLVTDGSSLAGLPVDSCALTITDVHDLIEETSKVREQILDMVRYLRRKPPRFVPIPSPDRFQPAEETPTQRALQTANLLGRAWTAWLDTDQQRRKYTVDPKAMDAGLLPDDLSGTDSLEFPPGFADRVVAEPLV
jgi:hypothetical protein